MKIDAGDLGRLCYNAIQFSGRDSSFGGVVRFVLDDGYLLVYATDDYVALEDRAEVADQREFPETFHLGLKEIKDLEKTLRDYDGEVWITATAGHLDLYEHDWPLAENPPDFAPVVEILDLPPNLFDGGQLPFAIRAARFTKFRLLRTPPSPSTKSEYPVDFNWDGDLLRWKCGPYLRGVLAPLQRESFVTAAGEEVVGIYDLFATEREEVLW